MRTAIVDRVERAFDIEQRDAASSTRNNARAPTPGTLAGGTSIVTT